MSAPKHTAGPWERLEGVVEVGHPIYKPGTVVTRIVQKRAPDQTDFVKVALVDTGAANARLIAAAPDLLRNLENGICYGCNRRFGDRSEDGLKAARHCVSCTGPRAAIAKATGEGAK